ncbi:hypothetical protein [Mesorhizobium sp. M0129]|uniref:hypothetical protein n=1 Tax=Mesorhizobium sp. M0129 TaxID=2956886 RepID=UPI00333DD606
MTNRFKIGVGETSRDCKIELNGQPLEGVCRVSFDLTANSPTMLKLEIIGEVLADGEFQDDAILIVKTPSDKGQST